MAVAEHGFMLPTGHCELFTRSGGVAVIWAAVLLLCGLGQ